MEEMNIKHPHTQMKENTIQTNTLGKNNTIVDEFSIHQMLNDLL
jgi:hypothetical protein